MNGKIEILTRYNVTSSEELEEGIKSGQINEHPGWEDLIILENLESAIETLDGDIELIQ